MSRSTEHTLENTGRFSAPRQSIVQWGNNQKVLVWHFSSSLFWNVILAFLTINISYLFFMAELQAQWIFSSFNFFSTVPLSSRPYTCVYSCFTVIQLWTFYLVVTITPSQSCGTKLILRAFFQINHDLFLRPSIYYILFTILY